MPYEFDIIEKEDYLLFDVTGESATVEDVVQFTQTLLKEAMKRDCRSVMLDERGLRQRLDSHDAYLAAEKLVADRPRSGIRFASIRSDENWTIGKRFETIFQNRSINFRVFDNIPEAETWLAKAE